LVKIQLLSYFLYPIVLALQSCDITWIFGHQELTRCFNLSRKEENGNLPPVCFKLWWFGINVTAT